MVWIHTFQSFPLSNKIYNCVPILLVCVGSCQISSMATGLLNPTTNRDTHFKKKGEKP